MKLIYITGLSHSGSTLLDLMLHAHTKLFSVGELKKLQHHFITTERDIKRRCTCNSTLMECKFWQQVNNHLVTNSQRQLDQIASDFNLKNVDVNHDTFLTLDAISKTSGKEYVIDSSKDLARLRAILKNQSLSTFTIHIVRNPSGQINSMLKADQRGHWKGRVFNKPFIGFKKLLFLIHKYNTVISSTRHLLSDKTHIEIHYEDLVNKPEETLSAILEKLGLSFEPSQLNWAGTERHLLAGNRMRNQFTNELKIDLSWKTELRWWQKLLIYIGTLKTH